MKPFFFKFFRTLIHMEAVFWSTEIVFFNESFILASGNDFPLITNLLVLFRVFFFTILEIKCRPFFKGEYYSFLLKLFSWVLADIPASGSSFFRLVETDISSFITTSVCRFWFNFKLCALFRAVFSASGKHY